MKSDGMTKETRTYNGIKTVYLINGIGKIGQTHAKNKTRIPSYTTYKNELKLD